MGVVAAAVAAAEEEAGAADILEVIMGVIMEDTTEAIRVMEGAGVIIMGISFPESSVMVMGPIPTEAAAIHAIQG